MLTFLLSIFKAVNASAEEKIVSTFIETLLKWKIELLALFCFALYGLLYIIGKHKNQLAARKITTQLIEALKNEFSQVGIDDKTLLLKDGANEYTLFLTGNSDIDYMTIRISLLPRQEIFSYAYSIYNGAKDSIEIFARLDEIPEKFVFALIRRTDELQLKKESYDLNKAVKRINPPALTLPTMIASLSEHSDVVEKVFETKMFLDLEPVAEDLKYIVFSDLPFNDPESVTSLDAQTSLRMCFNVSDCVTEAFSILIKNILLNLSKLKEISFKADTKLKIKKTRQELSAYFEKIKKEEEMEEIQRARSEAKRKERQEVIKKSVHEQKKFDEKERKKALKKQMKKRTIKG